MNYKKIYGSSRLVKRYQKATQSKLDLGYNEASSLRDYFAFNHFLNQDKEKFHPRFVIEEAGMIINAKQDFYLSSSILINRLALACNVESEGDFKKIKSLLKNKVINKEASDHLTWLLAKSLYLRFEDLFLLPCS